MATSVQNVSTGVGTGTAVGTAILPGIGTAIGAVAGLVGSLTYNLFHKTGATARNIDVEGINTVLQSMQQQQEATVTQQSTDKTVLYVLGGLIGIGVIVLGVVIYKKH